MSMRDEARDNGSGRAARAPKKKKTFKEAFIPQKGDSSAEIINKVIVMLSVVVFIVCLAFLGNDFYEKYEAKKNHNNLKVIYKQAQQVTGIPTLPPESGQTLPPVSPEAGETPVQTERAPLVELPAAVELLAINRDTVGYVSIPGCVDEPVVKGSDNKYYLEHNFYNAKRQCGTCFADYRNTVGGYDRSDNVILYAHNQKDGTMFGNLDYYHWDPAYWLKNPFIYFNSNYSEDTYVIFSSFIINTKPEHDNGKPLFDYQNYIDFNDTYPYDKFIDEVTKRSMIITGVECNEKDEYLTLSTCSYDWDEARHIIVARKLREGETADSLDTTNFRKNPNPKWPAVYYKYNGGTYIEE